MPAAVGMRFGRYELLQKLGAGGMGEVYRARDHDLGRDVAVKFLSERFAADTDRLARFAKEARAASSLNHPNIVTIHEIGSANGLPFIVMELVEGKTLRNILLTERLSTRRVLDVAAQAADGLAKAHAAGIVHRDLKPENLMVTPDGFVKILDFGLAKLRVPGSEDTTVQDSAPTGFGAEGSPESTGAGILGTVGYMAPEQAAGRPVDFRADQFAFGTILYEMASGQRAFKRETPVQTMSAIIEADPEPIGSLSPAFPPPAQWVVERCLAKDPAHRFASTADLARELRDIKEHLGESSTDSRARPRPQPAPRRLWWRTASIALALCLGLLLVPSVRDGILGPLQVLPLPSDKRIAVLPFHNASGPADAQLCDGLVEYITARLGQIERFQRSAWVVPANEVRQAGVTTADKALRALGATLAVSGSLQRQGDTLVFTASLVDTGRVRQLRATAVQVAAGRESLLEVAADTVVRMLELELGPDGRATLHAGGTGVAEAATLYAQALGYTPYRQARTALERHEQRQSLERAIQLFTDALEHDPRYALAHAGLGEAYWRLWRLTKNPEHAKLAEAHAQRAVALDATLAEAWITLGIIHTGTGKAEQAVDDLQRALAREPRNPDAYRELANAYRRLQRQADAERTYQRALELQPDSWVTRNNYASYLFAVGQQRYGDAEAQYKRALEIVPDNARLWYNLGGTHWYQGKRDEARAAFRKSLELSPTAPAASNLAVLQFYEAHYGEAARTLESAVRLDDRDYRVWRNLGAAYYWAPGERDKAREAYRRCVDLGEQERAFDPNEPWLLAELADCYAMLDKPDSARPLLIEAQRVGGDQAGIAHVIAGAYEQMGERELALEWIAKAVGLGEPREDIERDPSLEALRKDGRYSKAVGAR